MQDGGAVRCRHHYSRKECGKWCASHHWTSERQQKKGGERNTLVGIGCVRARVWMGWESHALLTRQSTVLGLGKDGSVACCSPDRVRLGVLLEATREEGELCHSRLLLLLIAQPVGRLLGRGFGEAGWKWPKRGGQHVHWQVDVRRWVGVPTLATMVAQVPTQAESEHDGAACIASHRSGWVGRWSCQ